MVYTALEQMTVAAKSMEDVVGVCALADSMAPQESLHADTAEHWCRHDALVDSILCKMIFGFTIL